MLRRPTLALLALIILATACSTSTGDGGGTRDPGTTSMIGAPQEANDLDASASQIFGGLNPLGVLGALPNESGGSSTREVDSALAAVLLDGSDAPGFHVLGEDALLNAGGYDSLTRGLTDGCGGDGDRDTLVVSSVVEVPPEELEDIPDRSELTEMVQVELERWQEEPEAALFSDLRLLDSSGLGDTGYGLHWVADLRAIEMEAYVFVRGSRLYSLNVVWGTSESSGVDSRALAERLDQKAQTGGDDDASSGEGSGGSAPCNAWPALFDKLYLYATSVVVGLGEVGSLDPISPDQNLLGPDDLPSGFLPVGQFESEKTYTELGNGELSVNIFTNGDPAQPGYDDVMVMSGTFALPAEAMEKLRLSAGQPDELALQERLEKGLPFDFLEVEILPAPALGEGSFWAHVEVDFQVFFETSGLGGEANVTVTEMILFLGEEVQLVGVTWPAGSSPGVSALELAERLGAKD